MRKDVDVSDGLSCRPSAKRDEQCFLGEDGRAYTSFIVCTTTTHTHCHKLFIWKSNLKAKFLMFYLVLTLCCL